MGNNPNCQKICYSNKRNEVNVYSSQSEYTNQSIFPTDVPTLPQNLIIKFYNYFLRSLKKITNEQFSINSCRKKTIARDNKNEISFSLIKNSSMINENENELKLNNQKLSSTIHPSNSIIHVNNSTIHPLHFSGNNTLIKGTFLKHSTLHILKEDKKVNHNYSRPLTRFQYSPIHNRTYMKIKPLKKDKLTKRISINNSFINELDEFTILEENTSNYNREMTHGTNKSFLTHFTNNTKISIFSNVEVIYNRPNGYFPYKKQTSKYLGMKDHKKRKQGFGIILFEDKSEFKGIFVNDKASGNGMFIDNGEEYSVYLGNYLNNSPKGFGVFQKDKIVLIGDNWEKNKLDGIGVELSFNDFYQGEFQTSVKQGIGLYHWKNNTVCFGEWNDDNLNGYGVIKFDDQHIYIGEIKDGLMNGWGEFYWGNNTMYCGQYKNGIKLGFGIYVSSFKKLDAYIGFWKEGKIDGVGIFLNDKSFSFWRCNNGKKIDSINQHEIIDYLKFNHRKFYKILGKDYKYLKNFILSLKDNEISKENFNYTNVYHFTNLYFKNC